MHHWVGITLIPRDDVRIVKNDDLYDKLFYTTIAPTSVYLQLADQSICYLEGVATDLLVKVRSAYIPTDL